MLEELLALGIKDAEYDAYLIDIGQGEQFSSGFVALNPNSKIPAMLDTTNDIRVFEYQFFVGAFSASLDFLEMAILIDV